MKRLQLTALVVFASLVSAFGAKEKVVTPNWMNPAVNRVNVMTPRATFFAYESEELAQKMKKESSSRFKTMEGKWKFNWVKDHNNAPKDFFQVGYDDSKWVDFPVPGLFEIHGYGDRIYKNVGYAWATQFTSNPPYIEEKNNYTGSYRQEFEIPADWKGQNIYMYIGSATSNLTLWVNGKYVGYREDSKAASEFDLTKYLVSGKKNLFAMQVMRWCDGSYLEDQDFWRFTGIAREVYLYATPKAHVSDVFITPDLTNDYQDGTLNVKVNAENANGSKVKMVLKDKEGKEVAQAEAKIAKGETNYLFDVKNPMKWTAETPYLYTLYIILEKAGGVSEVIPQRVGFRKVEIKNSQLLVNGQPVLIKGADRHELDPKGGYVVPVSRMIQDIQVMKKCNINAIRTCHYEDDPRWYDLCDEYGIYLTAETNIESHGMGYDEKTLAKDERFQKEHVDRQKFNVYVNKNHPSVIVWSLGNEAGMGVNFELAYKFVKAFDPSRPVQYERACFPSKNKYEYANPFKIEYSDIYCPMYESPKNDVKYLEQKKPQPLIQCEYSHAMGNSSGNFKEYWDLVRKYPNYQGGYIWDFVDQGLSDVNKDGKKIYTYGGDYGRYPASDNNFNCNGFINPDREMHPHAYEIAYYYQNIWTTIKDVKNGKVEVYNENFFRTMDYAVLNWKVVSEGEVVCKGSVDNLSVKPQQKTEVTLNGYKVPAGNKEVYLYVEYNLKKDEPLMKQNQKVAYQQFSVRGYQFPTEEGILKAAADERVIKEEQLACLILKGGNLTVTFNKATGWIDYIDGDNMSMMEKGYSLMPDFWRASNDNDMGAKINEKFWKWRNPTFKKTSFNYTDNGSYGVVAVEYDIPETSSKLNMTYKLTANGELLVNEKLITDSNAKEKPGLYRFGMQMVMPEMYNELSYYGRGPIENYCDRNNCTPVDVYSDKVANQYWGYVRPQESGNKTDIRWWKVQNMSKKGLVFYGVKPMECSTLNYLTADLDDGLQKAQRHSGDLTPRPFSVVHISDKQMGVGGINSWGTWPLDEYQIKYGDRDFTFVIKVTE